MEAEAAEAAAGEEGGARWISSIATNWIVAEGSLHDSISFDSSSTSPDTDNDVDTEAKGVLLLRPDQDDPPPCEITVCFRETHEIHMVYVRSTARVYEIYYASDHQDSSKEYLCTVRCGAASREAEARSVFEGTTDGCQGSNKGIAEKPEQVVRSDSNNSDEDGWVQVKVPDPLQDDTQYSLTKKCDKGIDSPKTQIHFEATAEISDASPCVSLTLRLLSIQTKASVHIEEIYIYADPVESTSLDPPVTVDENLGGSSMLAMLVPSLLHLSKAQTSRVNCSSDEQSLPKYQLGTEKTAQTISPEVSKTVVQEAYFCMSPDQERGPVQEPTKVKPEEIQSEFSQKLTDPTLLPKSLNDQNNNLAFNRLERVMDELVSRLGRVEAFCSRFEENMMKPLSCMEIRLQRLEQKLDALAVRSQSSEQFLCSRISAPDLSDESNFLSDESDSENKGCHAKCTEARENTTFHGTALPANDVTTVLGSQTRPGLIVKAPEFANEDDECANNESPLDSFINEDVPKDKKSVSIDSALASSLAAFVTSTTANSPKPTPSLVGISQESSNGNNNALDSSVRVPSEEAGNLSDKSVFEDNGCILLDAVRKGSCFDDSSLSPDAAAATDMSDMKSEDYDRSDGVREGTAFDDQLLVTNGAVLSPIYASSSLTVAPEFLNRDSSLNCDDNLGSPVFDWFKDQVSMPIVVQSVSPLSAAMILTWMQSPKIIPTLINAPSDLSNADSSELAASFVAFPSEVADESGVESHEENVIEDQVELDPILDLLPHKVSLEQEEDDCMGLKAWLSKKTTDAGLFTQNLPLGMAIELNGGVSKNCHGTGCTDDNYVEQTVPRGFNGLSRGWTDDNSNTGSSFDEKLVRNEVEIEWSDRGNRDSSRNAFTVTDNSKWQAYSNSGRAPVSIIDQIFSHTDYTTGTCQSFAGCSQKKSNIELEQALSSSVDMINTLKVGFERNLTSLLPLEVLLGEASYAKLHEAAAEGGDSDGQQQHNSLSTEGIDWKADADGTLLIDVEDPTLLTEATSIEEGLQGPAGSGNPHLFSSII